MIRSTTSALLLSILVPGCAVPTFHSVTAAWDDDDETVTESDVSTTDDAGSTWSGPISTVTSATSSSGSEGASATDATDTAGDTDDATTGDVDAPPKISDHHLAPSPIKFAGAIEVQIWIDGGLELADGVRMVLDGAEVELTPNPDTGAFEGEILAVSGFQNDDEYVATFVAYRGDLESDPRVVPYAIALHDPGDEDLWNLDKSGGSGKVSAIDVLPEGDVLELVTLAADVPKCILRRRDSSGVLLEAVDLDPDYKCKAIDIEVDDDTGAVFLLMEEWTPIGWLWWLTRAPYYGAKFTTVMYGAKDEVAHALALSGAGTIAVCGSTPTPEPDDLSDAVVHIIRPDFSDDARTFDQVNEDNKGHLFDERARGCAFDPSDEDRLVIVGEVYGKHDNQLVEKNNRRFDVIYDVEADDGELRVASAGLEVHSLAVDVAFAEGQTFVLGSVCGDDACEHGEGKLWALDADGDLASTRSLGLFSNKALHPSRVRVSPAGYLVVTSGGLSGSEEAFLVRAYDPFKAEPLFTYVRQDAGLFHLAHALAIGPYGQIYAGGFGANGYPLFVIIYG